MKKILFIMLLAVLGIPQLGAQEYEYVPFVREGVKWVCYYKNNGGYGMMDQYFGPGKTYFTLELKGDTVIDGQEYKALHKYGGSEINTADDTVLVYLREEDRVVYGIKPVENKYYGFNDMGYGGRSRNEIPELINSGQEFILLEYNDPETYYTGIFSAHPHGRNIETLNPDFVTLGDKKVLRHKFKHTSMEYEYYIIEGVGVDGYQPGYLLDFMKVDGRQSPYFLSHIIENGQIVYKGINHDFVAPSDGRLPLLREGVTWVNERVVVENGDTTRYYYSYELQDENYECLITRMSCHYHSFDKAGGDDAMVAELEEDPYMFWLYCYTNLPLEKVIEQSRYLMNYDKPNAVGENGERVLYFFDHQDMVPDNTVMNYITSQLKPKILTYDNFTEVDPVVIDDHECRRFAYVDETGEVQAYLVEGIGFDSRDMGDLLTPFTRKPDPDADYQEWCGLSHVIKDGQIIYKGLRYDEERVNELLGGATELPGDVNDDGVVDIADVTALIDLVLNGRHLYRAPADMDSDGSVDINDITGLIEIILGNR